MELKMLSENLQQKNLEVRRLNKEMKQCKETIVYLRNELALCQYHNLQVTKQDAETMAGVCCTEPECGDYEPVKECVPPAEREQMQEKVENMQVEIKSSSESLLRLRRMNAALSKEVVVLHRLCGALHDQCRSVCISSQFKDDIIREMRRQLKQAKAKAIKCFCEAATNTVPSEKDEMLTLNSSGSSSVQFIKNFQPVSSPLNISKSSLSSLEQRIHKRACPSVCFDCSSEAGSDEQTKMSNLGHSIIKDSTQNQKRRSVKDCKTIKNEENKVIIKHKKPMISLDESKMIEKNKDAKMNQKTQIGIKKVSKEELLNSSCECPIVKKEQGNTNVETSKDVEAKYTTHMGIKIRSNEDLDITSSKLKKEKYDRNVETPGDEKPKRNKQIGIKIKSDDKLLKSDGSCTSIKIEKEGNANVAKLTCGKTVKKKQTGIKKIYCDCATIDKLTKVKKQKSNTNAEATEGRKTKKKRQIGIKIRSSVDLLNSGCDTNELQIRKNSAASSESERTKTIDQMIQKDKETKINLCGPCTEERDKDTQMNYKIYEMSSEQNLRNEEFEQQNDETESLGASSLPESVAESALSDAAARADYYHNKLLATLKVLENKEQTVLVQAQSLCVCEARIAALRQRAAAARAERDRKTLQIQELQEALEKAKLDRHGTSPTSDCQAYQEQSSVVKTLQSNLEVIEELYRDCFFEAAKQDDLINMLRKSYLDVRLMDEKKSEQIGKLQRVVNTQKWSLDKCQDIAAEVENLKVEITNFLSSSNNDSGMWEESLWGADVSDELQQIKLQLEQLQQLLTCDCNCELQKENMILKKKNEEMEIEMEKLQQRLCEAEMKLHLRESAKQKCEELLREKETELTTFQQKILDIENSKEETNVLKHLLQSTQDMLANKTEELSQVQLLCKTKEDTIKQLREELDKADHVIKEGSTCLRRRVRLAEERRARDAQQLHAINESYREKEQRAQELERQLYEATRRGAELCTESRRVVRAVRAWAQRMHAIHSDQQNKITEQELLICSLHRRLGEKRSCNRSSGSSERDPCTKCIRERRTDRSRTSEHRRTICPQCSSVVDETVAVQTGVDESEMASCSSAPVPPKRTLRRKSCGERCRHAAGPGPGSGSPSDASAMRAEATHAPHVTPVPHAPCRTLGPHVTQSTHATHVPHDVPQIDEIVERVECLSSAWLAGQRRWSDHTLHLL